MKKVIAAVLCLICACALAQEERYTLRPAIQTPYAEKALLVDVDWAGERLVAVGEQGHIIYSDDAGASWEHANVPVSLMLTAVAFPASEQGWAVGHEGIVLKSLDRGSTWTVALTGEDIATLQIEAARRLVAEAEAALNAAPDEEIEEASYALEDAQIALEDAQRASEEGLVHPALDVWFETPQTGYIVGAYAMLLKTTDGGQTWQLHSPRLDNPFGYHYYGIARLRSGTLLIAGEAGQLHRSTDNGETWEALAAPYEGSFFGVLSTGDGGGLLFGLRGNIFRTEDDGATWNAIDAPGESALFGGQRLGGTRIVLVGSAGTVLQSEDGGRSFGIVNVDGRSAFAGVDIAPGGELVIVGFGGVRVVDDGKSGGSS